ncbi:MAG: hypothetical protein MRY78_18025 [Saprospiraceae bacterium]|nr:hypothetical protein [Saprospiraceae bacterium]
MRILSIILLTALLMTACGGSTSTPEQENSTSVKASEPAPETETPTEVQAYEQEEKTEEELDKTEAQVTERSVETVEDDILEGHYSYFADVGYFKNCEDNKNYLVRLRKQTVEMESEYLKLMKETNEKIFVRVKGHFVETGKETTLVVDEFLGFQPGESCKS